MIALTPLSEFFASATIERLYGFLIRELNCKKSHSLIRALHSSGHLHAQKSVELVYDVAKRTFALSLISGY